MAALLLGGRQAECLCSRFFMITYFLGKLGEYYTTAVEM